MISNSVPIPPGNAKKTSDLNKNCSVQEYSGESIVSPAFAATFVSSASVTDFSAHVTHQGPLSRVSYEITDDGTVAVKSQT